VSKYLKYRAGGDPSSVEGGLGGHGNAQEKWGRSGADLSLSGSRTLVNQPGLWLLNGKLERLHGSNENLWVWSMYVRRRLRRL
jgi:hypothetical protein